MTFKNRFLHSGYKAKTQVFANLAYLTKKVEIQNDCLTFFGASPQEVQKLIHNKEQAVIRVNLKKCLHHVFKGSHVIRNPISSGELVVNIYGCKVFFQLLNQQVPQRHFRCTDYSTEYLEPSSDLSGSIADTSVVQPFQQGGICGNTGNHRHQMRFTGAVVTDDQQPLVIDRVVELHLRNDKLREPLGHFLGNDIGVHECVCGARFVRVTQLNDRLNRVELDKVSVFHGNSFVVAGARDEGLEASLAINPLVILLISTCKLRIRPSWSVERYPSRWAISNWVSTSASEPFEIDKNRWNSFVEFLAWPSAMFDGIATTARRS